MLAQLAAFVRDVAKTLRRTRGFLGLDLFGYILRQCQKATKAHDMQVKIYKANQNIELEIFPSKI
jgi:hypothetical protein